MSPETSLTDAVLAARIGRQPSQVQTLERGLPQAVMDEIVKRAVHELDTQPKFVRGWKSGQPWHVAASCDLSVPTAQWRTRCGWRFAELGRCCPDEAE